MYTHIIYRIIEFVLQYITTASIAYNQGGWDENRNNMINLTNYPPHT